jgi:hypothetical protein
MDPLRQAQLCRSILVTLQKQARNGTWATWLRFLAREEARRIGGSALDAEQALKSLYDQGYLALAFGYERGGLAKSKTLSASRSLSANRSQIA